jgi:hypothetical protein
MTNFAKSARRPLVANEDPVDSIEIDEIRLCTCGTFPVALKSWPPNVGANRRIAALHGGGSD